MGLPHSGQIGIGPSAAMCLALHLRRAAPFWYRPEPALLPMGLPSCVGCRWLWRGSNSRRPGLLVCYDHALAIAAMAGWSSAVRKSWHTRLASIQRPAVLETAALPAELRA